MLGGSTGTGLPEPWGSALLSLGARVLQALPAEGDTLPRSTQLRLLWVLPRPCGSTLLLYADLYERTSRPRVPGRLILPPAPTPGGEAKRQWA